MDQTSFLVCKAPGACVTVRLDSHHAVCQGTEPLERM